MSRITNMLRKAEEDREGHVGTAHPHSGNGNGNGHGNGHDAVVVPPVYANGSTAQPEAALQPESWEKTMALVKQQLLQHEEQMNQYKDQAESLNARLTESDGLIAKLEQDRQAMRQQMEQISQTIASNEKSRALWVRQLDALKECEQLSQACRAAEQELKDAEGMVEKIAESRRQIEQELVHYQRRGEALRQGIGQLKFRLGQALAATGTTG